MLLVFTFAFDTETKEAAVGGNIDSQFALGVLQSIIIAQAIAKSKLESKEKEDASQN